MNKYSIRLLIFFVGVSLVGLVSFQIHWVGNIIQANNDAFKGDVQEALNAVTAKLEKQEALEVTIDNFHTEFIYKSLSSSDSNKIELVESTFKKKVIEIKDYLQYADSTPDWLSFYFNSEEEGNLKDVSIRIRDDIKPSTSTKLEIEQKDTIITNRKVYQKKLDQIAKKSEYVQLAMHRLFSKERTLEERVKFDELDSLIRSHLEDRGIDIDYQFVVFDPVSKEIIYQERVKSVEEVLSSEMKAYLFPNDVLGEAGYVSIYFPDQISFIVGKIWWTLSSSVLFIAIILACFWYAIHTIFKQKKLSEIKNDFINNMTHEFKTPISTVSLACEALQDKDIQGSAALTFKYLKIIDDENNRLGKQVEKVLQMAVIDKNDFELKLESVDVHEVITNVLESISIQITSKSGIVSTKFNAVKKVVRADLMHLTNMIYNLVDNANKYSTYEPKIEVETYDRSEHLYISVKDQGIGMSKEHLARVFEKFYRVPTGNRHDVKGFGLGLAYVKSMVEAHGGHIEAKSEISKGSTFILKIPYLKVDDND
ncbi:sensor histidine kinase [Reichenbachiella versicolor]|uniref:sensor histidine kinase n=1 Tax=Reichenbachiella versicolor TaxID=1821036 RepID=UPI000D6E37D5|nr:HAMP domain-containing sensor histidine kinase [Reichenbachiella versicolor]